MNSTGSLPAPRKSLGQHWLQDEHCLEAMLEAAAVTNMDTVLEIGPGTGTLTQKLVQKAKQVVAVEFDSELAKELSARNIAPNLTVVHQDILRFDLSNLPPRYKVVANIPYYLTSHLLRNLCESSNHFSQAAILLQKEVAERVCARPGSMSLLGVSVQFYCEARLGEVVPAHLFSPPPKVDSQILHLTFRDRPLFPDVNAPAFFRVVKAGFSQRRKTLLNTLSSSLHLSREQTRKFLLQSRVDPSARPQTLNLAGWYTLYITLEPYIQKNMSTKA